VDLGVLGIDDVTGRAGRKTQPKLFDPRLDFRRSAKQKRFSEILVYDHLSGSKHPLVFPLREDD
jgi:hypothetical protein